VEIKETQMGSVPGTIPVAPISVNIYRLPLAQAQWRSGKLERLK